MKYIHNIVRLVLLSIMMIQVSMGDTIKLSNGASFEAKVFSIEDGYHVFEIPESQITQVRYGTPDYVRFSNNTDVSTTIVKFVENNYYIRIKNSDISSTSHLSASSLNNNQTTKPNDMKDFILSMHGSNTIGASLAPALVKGYLESIGAKDVSDVQKAKEEKEVMATLNGKKIKIRIHAHGSTTGFEDLAQVRCDVTMSSRRIKPEEVTMLAKFGDMKSIENEHIIAIDGVAIFVNQKNSIFRLSTGQIKDIYTGVINDWSQIGGKSGKINLYARDEKSGTWDTFNSLILNKLQISKNAKRYEDNKKLSDDVSMDIDGIGFGGLPYILNTKELAVSDGEMTIKPDKFTVATEDYPLSRRLYLYNKGNASKFVKGFIAFVLSAQGQKIVDNENFIDLNIKEFKPIISDEMPTEYKNLAKELTRLSTNFRFETNSKNLDNKALRDLSRVVKYLQDNQFKPENIYLIGFADNVGSAEKNKILSEKRAKSVLYSIKSEGVIIAPENIIGIGEDYPVANNADEMGRDKNRRVEIWVRK